MHGLIFETSVWLLAESTRLLSITSLSPCYRSTENQHVGSSDWAITVSPAALQLSSTTFPPACISINSHILHVRTESGTHTTWFSRLVGHAPGRNNRASSSVCKTLPTNTVQSPGQPSYLSVAPATLKQASLGKEIKSTTTESATVNQLPQSGISRNTQRCSKQIQKARLFSQPSLLIGSSPQERP